MFKEVNMTEKKTSNKKVVLGLVALVAVIVAMAVIFCVFRQKPVEGSKAIVIEVIDNEEKTTTYELKTDAEYLYEAMKEAKGLTFDGEETEFGFTLYSVNGLEADFTKDSAYWSLYVNGEYGMYGVSGQPVLDGETYTFKYEVYVAE